MTLILVLMNADQAVQLSDRRLTSVGRTAPLDDESDKAIIWQTANARLAVGYTGLARTPWFGTHDWLLENLAEVGEENHHEAQPMIEAVRQRLSRHLSEGTGLRGLDQGDKRLTVMFSGYLYHHDPPLMGNAMLTNFQDWDSGTDSAKAWPEFRTTYFNEIRPLEDEATYVQRIGAWGAMNPADERALRDLLEARKPVEAIRGKGIALMREMAARPKAKGTIGKQISSIVIPRDASAEPSSGYHSEKVGTRWYGPSQVISQPGLGLAMKGMTIEEVSPHPSPMVGPKRPRNAPCWCGSGAKYKKCHGKEPPQLQPPR